MRQSIGDQFTFAMPAEVRARVEALAAERAKKTGKNVSYGEIVRELVIRGLKEAERRR